MSAGTERTDQAFVRAALAGSRLEQVRWVSETGSTNADLAAAARDGAGEQVLITDLQTEGRGRRDRTWEAPPRSGILMSVLLRDVQLGDGFWFVAAVALSAAQAIDALTLAPCSLKWPNDVMLGEGTGQRKAAGVLAQLVDNGIVVGIGINANWPTTVSSEMAERGTSVNRHTKDRTNVDRAPLAADILQRVVGHVEAAPSTLRAAWKANCSTLGQHVRLELERGSIVGIAVDVDDDGALQIEEEGRRTTHQVGDVVHLRPAG